MFIVNKILDSFILSRIIIYTAIWICCSAYNEITIPVIIAVTVTEIHGVISCYFHSQDATYIFCRDHSKFRICRYGMKKLDEIRLRDVRRFEKKMEEERKSRI